MDVEEIEREKKKVFCSSRIGEMGRIPPNLIGMFMMNPHERRSMGSGFNFSGDRISLMNVELMMIQRDIERLEERMEERSDEEEEIAALPRNLSSSSGSLQLIDLDNESNQNE